MGLQAPACTYPYSVFPPLATFILAFHRVQPTVLTSNTPHIRLSLKGRRHIGRSLFLTNPCHILCPAKDIPFEMLVWDRVSYYVIHLPNFFPLWSKSDSNGYLPVSPIGVAPQIDSFDHLRGIGPFTSLWYIYHLHLSFLLQLYLVLPGNTCWLTLTPGVPSIWQSSFLNCLAVRARFELAIISISTLIKQRFRCTSVRKFLHQCFGACSNSPSNYVTV